MSSEAAIEKCVERHFEKLGFATKTQYRIQIGSNVGRADVVIYKPFAFLSEPLDHIAAIVECKARGKVGHGVDQLYSYLSATDTRLGVFANSPSPTNWKYYENYGRNNIAEITREEFERLLRNEKQNQEDFQRRIQARAEQRIDQIAERLVTETPIQKRLQEAKKRVKEYENYGRSNIAEKAQAQKNKGCLISILVLGGLVTVLLLSVMSLS